MELDTDGNPIIPNDIPDIPQDVYNAGWVRDEINYPSYKDFIRTADPDKQYDFYADFIIEGERHTYFFRRTSISDVVDNWQALIDELQGKVVDMANESGEELGIVPSVNLDFVWRAIKPVETEATE